MRIFLDANILFSASKSDGAVRELLARAVGAGHSLCADGYVAAEAHRNLEAKAPSGLPSLDGLIGRLELAVYRHDTLAHEAASLLPEKDRPVLAAAVRMRCDVLVTGDRTHFGQLYGRTVLGVEIHSPHSLAEALGLT